MYLSYKYLNVNVNVRILNLKVKMKKKIKNKLDTRQFTQGTILKILDTDIKQSRH